MRICIYICSYIQYVSICYIMSYSHFNQSSQVWLNTKYSKKKQQPEITQHRSIDGIITGMVLFQVDTHCKVNFGNWSWASLLNSHLDPHPVIIIGRINTFQSMLETINQTTWSMTKSYSRCFSVKSIRSICISYLMSFVCVVSVMTLMESLLLITLQPTLQSWWWGP